MSGGKRYEAVFLDVDGTLLWVDLDVEGYVGDLASYATNGPLTVERARGPVWDGLYRHIRGNIEHPTSQGLHGFRVGNARMTAGELGIEAPSEVLLEVADRRTLFNPYPEAEDVLRELRRLGVPLYILSNWDMALEDVLDGLGWTGYFDGVVASAAVGVEKPDPRIFQAALRMSGVGADRALHVGNDHGSDVEGAAGSGIDAVFVDRAGSGESQVAVTTMPDLGGLPRFVRDCWGVG